MNWHRSPREISEVAQFSFFKFAEMSTWRRQVLYVQVQVQVLQNCTRVQVQLEYMYQVLHLCLILLVRRQEVDGSGGDNWCYTGVRRANSSQIITTNKPTPSFLQARCPSCRPTNSVKALKGKTLINQKSTSTSTIHLSSPSPPSSSEPCKNSPGTSLAPPTAFQAHIISSQSFPGQL